MKFKPFRIQQRALFTVSRENLLDYIDQQLPKKHLSRLIKTAVSAIGTSNIEEKYSSYGQNTYHPKLMLSLLFYGYATGVRSSRKLEEKCQSSGF
jgi:transposase